MMETLWSSGPLTSSLLIYFCASPCVMSLGPWYLPGKGTFPVPVWYNLPYYFTLSYLLAFHNTNSKGYTLGLPYLLALRGHRPRDCLSPGYMSTH